jgi:hypothetical protein
MALVFLVLSTTQGGAVTIVNDAGGNLWSYYARLKEWNRKGEHIRIMGTCASACTLYLAARRYCVDRHAVLLFHAAVIEGNQPDSSKATLWLLSMYPPKVKQWINIRGGLTSQLIDLRGAELRLRVRTCA